MHGYSCRDVASALGGKRASQMEFLLSASLSDHTALLTMLEIERPICIGLSQQFGGSLMFAHHSKTTCTHTPLGSECKGETASFVTSDNESTSVSRVTVVFVFSSHRTREQRDFERHIALHHATP